MNVRKVWLVVEEIWKDFVFDGLFYKVSRCGIIISLKTDKTLTTRLDSDGYLCVTMGCKSKRRCVRVHRVVGLLFLENPFNLPELHHINGDRANPSADNLKWVTHIENIRESVIKGNYIKGKGEDNNNAKLKTEQVKEIRNLYNDGITRYKIAKMFNVTWSTIDNIIKNKNWTHI